MADKLKLQEGFHTLNPSLIVQGAKEAIEFYKKVFDAKLRGIFEGPDGNTIHAELEIGDSILMLSDEFPKMGVVSPKSIGGGTSASLYMYVDDVDKVFNKAISEGATVMMPLEDAFWGDRAGGITDPFGHHWMLATHIKDIPKEELEKITKEIFSNPR